MKKSTIALIDGNNFFASCEILRNPKLKGKPVCVLSNNDGCVIARSPEAKKIGITMGMPYFMAKKSFPEAVYLSADFSLYHDLSQRMTTFLNNYSDKIDIYSIDEAFVDITGLDKVFGLSYEEIAKKIKYEVEEATGVNVSVGIAATKTLAKLATHKAKSKNGCCFIPDDDIFNEIKTTEIEEIWGIGKNLSRSLKKFGIFYAGEITLKDDEFFKKNFGKKGLELKYELSGKSVIPVTGISELPKSIQRTRAFPKFSKDREYIKTELNMHIHNVCKKLREYGLKSEITGVMLRTKDFRVFYRDFKVEAGINTEIEFIRTVFPVFEEMFVPDIIYRSSGIYAGGLISAESAQMSLFSNNIDKKPEKISKVMDKIESKFGKGIISTGKTGIKNILKTHERIVHREE